MYVIASPVIWNKTTKYPTIIRFVLAVLVGSFTIALYTLLLMSLVKTMGIDSTLFYRNFRFNLFVHLPAVVGFGYLIASWQQTDKARKEAYNLWRNNQLAPNTLYNSLQTILELVKTDVNYAEASIVALANYYNEMSKISSRNKISLRDEYLVMQHYLTFEATRFKNKLNVVWVWDRNLDNLQVPPMLIQPLLEIILKHSLSYDDGGEVQIVAEQDLIDHVKIRIKTKMDTATTTIMSKSLAIQNVKSRLHSTYNSQAYLNLSYNGSWAIVELVFNQKALKMIADLQPLTI
jgi:sensor histidine kinase YesM